MSSRRPMPESDDLCAEIHRKPARRFQGAVDDAGDDPYEKLMLSDLEIHPRAFDGRVRPVVPRDLCDRVAACRIKCSERRIVAERGRREYCGCLKEYSTLSPGRVAYPVGDTRNIKIANESFPR
ncbi:unnamed protein product [Lasius platythorax]|uniref:Uncharacterized protein n=1 Tax=Lasius platythorax TaxID=488582 RepID=A0AAV2PB81_9HYME